MIYQEVSAKAGTGIEKLFELTASRVIERWKHIKNRCYSLPYILNRNMLSRKV